MLSKSQIRFIRSLRQKKFRNKHQQFIVEGERSVRDLVQSDYPISKIYSTEEGLIRHAKATRISLNDLEKISGFKTPNRVLALARIPHQDILQEEPEQSRGDAKVSPSDTPPPWDSASYIEPPAD